MDHFDGHGEALKQYMRHRPMQHVQGYTGSHWTPPLGHYSLRIALAVGGRQGDSKQNNVYYLPNLMAISVVIAMQRYSTARIA